MPRSPASYKPSPITRAYAPVAAPSFCTAKAKLAEIDPPWASGASDSRPQTSDCRPRSPRNPDAHALSVQNFDAPISSRQPIPEARPCPLPRGDFRRSSRVQISARCDQARSLRSEARGLKPDIQRPRSGARTTATADSAVVVAAVAVIAVAVAALAAVVPESSPVTGWVAVVGFPEQSLQHR